MNEVRAAIWVDGIETFADDDHYGGGQLALQGARVAAARTGMWLRSPRSQGLYMLLVASKCWHPPKAENPDFLHFSDEPNFGVGVPASEATWPEHGVRDSWMTEYIYEAGVTDDDWDLVVLKGQEAHDYSVFLGTPMVPSLAGLVPEGLGLDTILRGAGVTHLDIFGNAFDVCDIETAAEARQKGYEVRILKNLTASVHSDNDEETTQKYLDLGCTVVEI